MRVYQEYSSSSELTVTDLHGLDASSTFLSGWSSGTIDNTTDKHIDKVVSAKFIQETTNLSTVGEIRVYAYAMLDDNNWPDIFSTGTEGTQGLVAIHDTEQLSSGLKLLWSTATDNTASDPHNMPPTSIATVFGFMPAKFALYITGTVATGTNNQFAGSGNKVVVKGLYETVS
jgi:hypothetical protein